MNLLCPFSEEFKQSTTLRILTEESVFMKSKGKKHTYFCEYCKCYARHYMCNLRKSIEQRTCQCMKTNASREANFLKHMHLIENYYFCRQSDHVVDRKKMSMDFVLVPKRAHPVSDNFDPFKILVNRNLEYIFIEILDVNHTVTKVKPGQQLSKHDRDILLGKYLLREYVDSRIVYVNIAESKRLTATLNAMKSLCGYILQTIPSRTLFLGKSHEVYVALLRSLI